MSVSAELARICMRPVDSAARQKAMLHLIDWIGCAAIGATTPTAKAIWQGTALPGAKSDATEASLDAYQDPWRSLLFEGAVGNILEMDDIHRDALLHPGPVIMPAALFIARRLQCSGPDLLDAIVRGYEAMARLGLAVGPGHYAYWHNTATCGPVGAAAAVSSLLGLSESALTHAFGHAATQAAGLWQVRLDPCMSKQWHTARAAQTGVQAALLAQSGVTGATHILEGEKGFFAAMCPDGDINLMLKDPLAPWQIFRTSIKPWPACRHAHAAIDATLALRERLKQLSGTENMSTALDAIAHIHVRTYADALEFCDKPVPRTPDEARFSLQHVVALTILRGEPTLPDFELAALQDPVCATLRSKITLECAQPWDGQYPRHFGAEVALTLIDASVLREQVDDARGDPERPLSDAAIIGKARGLMAAANYPSDLIEELLHQCLMLPQLAKGCSPPSIVIKAPVT